MVSKKNVFDNRKHISPDHPSYKKIDHLTYLKQEPSLFGQEDEENPDRTRLLCAECGHPVTSVSEKIEVFGLHEHDFTNLGYLVELGCFRDAEGCVGANKISGGYSWFRGYAWQIQVCKKCSSQLGWEYISAQESFYGLMFKMLREDDGDRDEGAAP